MVAKGQFPEVLLNEVKPKSVDPFAVDVFAALIRKSLLKDSSEPQNVFSDQFLPQMFTSRESSCSRSRRRAAKADKRMVLVHTHGLFIT